MNAKNKKLKADSAIYLAVAAWLDAGFQGFYGQLGHLVGVHYGPAVGQIVKKYARLHPGWDHWMVVSRRTGRPAYHP